jgi:hypothetical protein
MKEGRDENPKLLNEELATPRHLTGAESLYQAHTSRNLGDIQFPHEKLCVALVVPHSPYTLNGGLGAPASIHNKKLYSIASILTAGRKRSSHPAWEEVKPIEITDTDRFVIVENEDDIPYVIANIAGSESGSKEQRGLEIREVAFNDDFSDTYSKSSQTETHYRYLSVLLYTLLRNLRDEETLILTIPYANTALRMAYGAIENFVEHANIRQGRDAIEKKGGTGTYDQVILMRRDSAESESSALTLFEKILFGDNQELETSTHTGGTVTLESLSGTQAIEDLDKKESTLHLHVLHTEIQTPEGKGEGQLVGHEVYVYIPPKGTTPQELGEKDTIILSRVAEERVRAFAGNLGSETRAGELETFAQDLREGRPLIVIYRVNKFGLKEFFSCCRLLLPTPDGGMAKDMEKIGYGEFYKKHPGPELSRFVFPSSAEDEGLFLAPMQAYFLTIWATARLLKNISIAGAKYQYFWAHSTTQTLLRLVNILELDLLRKKGFTKGQVRAYRDFKKEMDLIERRRVIEGNRTEFPTEFPTEFYEVWNALNFSLHLGNVALTREDGSPIRNKKGEELTAQVTLYPAEAVAEKTEHILTEFYHERLKR